LTRNGIPIRSLRRLVHSDFICTNVCSNTRRAPADYNTGVPGLRRFAQTGVEERLAAIATESDEAQLTRLLIAF
jgi:hypothetical protein